MGRYRVALVVAVALVGLQAYAQGLTVYSGRSEGLVEPLVKQFEKDTGIRVNVRYGRDAELLAAIQEEGSRSPADVFWSNTSVALEAAVERNLLAKLPADLLKKPSAFVPSHGRWIPTSARFRVLAYNPSKIKPADLPPSVMDLPKNPTLKGRIGWTPTYSSFQEFIAAMRLLQGDTATRTWLETMKGSGAKSYPNNPAMLDALRAGEIDVALTNHYYIQRIVAGVAEGEFEGKDENEAEAQREAKAGVATYYFAPGDTGSLALVTGAGILSSSKQFTNASRFLSYLVGATAQRFIIKEIREYPVIPGLELPKGLLPFNDMIGRSPKLDFAKLQLDGALKLLREVGLL